MHKPNEEVYKEILKISGSPHFNEIMEVIEHINSDISLIGVGPKEVHLHAERSGAFKMIQLLKTQLKELPDTYKKLLEEQTNTSKKSPTKY